MHCDSSYAMFGERRRTTATGSWKAESPEAWPGLRLGVWRDAGLIVPCFDGFQGICKPLLQLSLANDPKECAEQSPLEILSLAHNHNVYVGRAVGPRR